MGSLTSHYDTGEVSGDGHFFSRCQNGSEFYTYRGGSLIVSFIKGKETILPNLCEEAVSTLVNYVYGIKHICLKGGLNPHLNLITSRLVESVE